MTELTYVDAAHEALHEELTRDPDVWAIGEDLGRGGVFGQYRGLQSEFGSDRVVDAPISEACMLGAAVGAAMMGTRPVVEMRVSDFSLCATDELVNQAAKARYMFGGQSRVPLVVRKPFGMWRSSAAQHSQSLEAWYAHIPGLVVVTPAFPRDEKALLKAAIRCDDPVVFLEHKNLWSTSGDPGFDDPPAEIGRARIVRKGDALTIVSWSAALHDCLAAAATLASESSIEVEIIDLRTIWPWDLDTVLASAHRTRRILVVHEAVSVAGFGAEVVATVSERLFGRLVTPPKRLGAPRIPVSYSPTLEDQVRVNPARIVGTVKHMLAHE
ncbi:alpha-ketoacid dehydrogenase subunit beta [Roseovarius sp. CAU 1744]|uniref:alpha-ketoacid dehydrogenase subunit beta n=1 Tax=Roseovarius sp. CAU 1744 TaxID=3140368 RepID=UPI00325BE76A